MMEIALSVKTPLTSLMEARKRGETAMDKLAGAAVEFRERNPVVAMGAGSLHFKFWADEPGVVAAKMSGATEACTFTAEDCAELSGLFDALARRLHTETVKPEIGA